MSKAFGTEFILVNDVMQVLDPTVFGGGPWMHIATVRRGLKEYIAFCRILEDGANPLDPTKRGEIYIEEIDPHEMKFNLIESDAEWTDLVNFLFEAHILELGMNRELKIDPRLLQKQS